MSEQMTVASTEAKAKPDYTKTAAALLARCREFYQNHENERAYQEWKAGRKAG